MNPAQKALWYIESHLACELTLDEVAAIGGVSRVAPTDSPQRRARRNCIFFGLACRKITQSNSH